MVYVYIYKESKTKVVQSDQKQDPRLCAILWLHEGYNMILVSSIRKEMC